MLSCGWLNPKEVQDLSQTFEANTIKFFILGPEGHNFGEIWRTTTGTIFNPDIWTCIKSLCTDGTRKGYLLFILPP